MIVGKSDKNNSDYDVLIFVRRDVEEIVIPSFIKIIGPYAFSETKIKTVLIPPKLIQICEGAFFNCKSLKKVEILANSELRFIEKDVFVNTSIDQNLVESILSKYNGRLYSFNSEIKEISIKPNDECKVAFNDLKIEYVNHSKNMNETNNGIFKKRFVMPEISLSGYEPNSYEKVISNLNYYSNLVYSFIEKSIKEFNETQQTNLIFDASLINAISDYLKSLQKNVPIQNLHLGMIVSLFQSVISCITFLNQILIKSKEELYQEKSSKYDLMNKEKMKCVRQFKKTKAIQENYNNLKKINNVNKSEMKKIRNERKVLSDLLRSYFNENQNVVSLIDQIEEKNTFGPLTLNDSIMEELIKNSKLSQYARRYSRTLKEVAFVLMTYSPSAYKMFTNFLPMPCLKTVRDSFKLQMNQTKENLLNIEQLQIILNKIHQIYTKDDTEIITSVLSCDAATMNPVKTGQKGFFAYNMQPIHPDYQSKIVHIELKDNGRFDENIISKAIEIIKIAEKSYFDVINFATDADSKTNPMHRQFYNFLIGIEGDFDTKVERMDEYEGENLISDPLHLYKSMRRKYLTNVIQMTSNGERINKENERKFLLKSPVYKDDVETNSQLAAMK